MAAKGFFTAFDDVWMLDGVRTPHVDYCGAFGHISPTDLGIKAAREALKRAGVPGSDIGSVVTGNMAPGDFDQFFLPRHIGLYAGVPVAVPAIMAQRICGTGFELFRQAGEHIQGGACEAALVVGTESMTRNPIAAFDHRTGFKLGAPVGFKDYMWEALKDPAAGINMIQTAENLARKYGITREQVDQTRRHSVPLLVAGGGVRPSKIALARAVSCSTVRVAGAGLGVGFASGLVSGLGSGLGSAFTLGWAGALASTGLVCGCAAGTMRGGWGIGATGGTHSSLSLKESSVGSSWPGALATRCISGVSVWVVACSPGTTKGATWLRSGISIGMSTGMGRGCESNSMGKPITPKPIKTAAPINRCRARWRNCSTLWACAAREEWRRGL